MSTGFGERNLRAEKLAHRAIGEIRKLEGSKAAVGRRLADQLMLPFAMAGGGAFRTLPLTHHANTNLWVIEQFLPGRTKLREAGGEVVVEFGPGDPC